ncbi:hypothetical protein [Olivibacter sp. XZL3]|uniref:hypothetical protein n=1 Tax=Olivibacter sp. XZL3 TaxID=1735116 RepID=UPI001065EDA5|nr:hypothetical protein [Olivibacter sp. XZL3]
MNYTQTKEVIEHHQLKSGSSVTYKGDHYDVIRLLPLPSDETHMREYIDTYLALYPTVDTTEVEKKLVEAEDLTVGALIKTDVIYRLVKVDELM